MKAAIMLMAHGADESENSDSAARNRDRLKETTGMEVYAGYLHLESAIADIAKNMLYEGVERIIAVPLFMFPGFLTDNTVRKAFGLEPGASSGTICIGGKTAEVIFTGTFADHPLMEGVLLDVCGENGASPEDTSILLIFHGNRNGSGAEYIECFSGYLTSRGFDVAVAYNEFQKPTVEEAVRNLMHMKKNILAIPMFVSPGTHTISDIPPKLGLDCGNVRDLGNGLSLLYAREIGMHLRIYEILKACIDETAGV